MNDVICTHGRIKGRLYKDIAAVIISFVHQRAERMGDSEMKDLTSSGQEIHFVPVHKPDGMPGDAIINHPRLRMTEHRSSYRVTHNFSEIDLLGLGEQIDTAFAALVQLQRSVSASDSDLIAVSFHHSELSKPIHLSFVRNVSFDPSMFANRLYSIAQSNRAFLLDGIVTITVPVLKSQSAGAPSVRTIADVRLLSRSLIEVVSTNVECGHVAIFLACYRKQNITKKAWKKMHDMRNGRCRNDRTELVKNLITAVNESQGNDSVDFDRALDFRCIEKYARHLNMRVVVYELDENVESSYASLVFKTAQAGDNE